MALGDRCLLLSILLSPAFVQAQFPPAIDYVVVIVQENRTPDNLFQGLYGLMGSNGVAYDIQNYWVDAKGGQRPLQPVGLATNFIFSHTHSAFTAQFTSPSSPVLPQCGGSGNQVVYGCAASTWNQFMYVDNNQLTYNNSYGQGRVGILDPYLNLAKQYGWANYMYQSNQGASYPAHQYLFGGTSARSASEDAQAVFVSENPSSQNGFAGCLSEDGTDFLIFPSGKEVQFNGSPGSLCFSRPTLASLLDAHHPAISWKYYIPGPPGSVWDAPSSIQDICQPNPNFTQCLGAEWNDSVDFNPVHVLTDIDSCKLSGVSWVVPNSTWSDHSNLNAGLGPSWVAAIVNAIGGKDNGCGYWSNTAIVITWDDWGGWFDHEPPAILAGIQGDYQYGFRVPLIIVSAYTQQGYVSAGKPHDFGSILKLIEDIFGLGSLGFADTRATGDLHQFFSLSAPRPYTIIPSVQDAEYFLNYHGSLTPPDED